MFKSKKRNFLVSAVLSLSLILAACGGDDDGTTDDGNGDVNGDTTGEDTTETDEGADEAKSPEYHWDFVTEEYQGQVQYEYAAEFARRMAEKSDGRVDITVYEFGGLGDEVDQVEQLQLGFTEFGIVSPGFTGTMVEEAQLFALHFLFPDDVALTQEILDSSEALNVHLREKYEEHNMTPLAYFTEGPMQWTSNGLPLTTPDDFDGFKMRIQQSPLISQSYEVYGADPTPMSWGELYTSLDQGVVDGQENPIFFIEDAGFHEVQDYMTISNHNNYVAMTVVNTDFYNGLPEDIQGMIDETVAELRDWVFDLQDQMNSDLLTAMEESEEHPTEIYNLTEDERQAFRDLAMPVRDFFRENYGDDAGRILDLLEEEIEAARN
ncbi:DctP family TRAP transporter solute-binding subunit [Evansella tamaricis]|uniref:DctP family TRAP transporter solute-binding subunit n=1 Tax=Evansella tamaricis TaxID=2069301 RepID=A0ABS6JGQ4_9BACI|nr:DctP family TRAP transporter solute-binding subunit [Evansella tamaricis]MBU9712575.1 DctP family TRAP transporter solute-binding subunit [Evansella tamaricis]